MTGGGGDVRQRLDPVRKRGSGHRGDKVTRKVQLVTQRRALTYSSLELLDTLRERSLQRNGIALKQVCDVVERVASSL